MAEAGDRCARSETGTYQAFRGIEVGHVFLLGTKYSAPLGCSFLDEEGKTQVMEMGCYGIGITRVAAAAIEQNHDADGIVWPMSIAPYEVEVVPLQMNDEAVVGAGEQLYAALSARGLDVLLDDRQERPGGKFKDADLIGIPLRIAIGKRSLEAGEVELKWRREAAATNHPIASIVDHVVGLVEAERARLAGGAR
jgi:prolyl-tRNA synthetase